MATGLVDTNVIVDMLRKYPPADNWLMGQRGLGITRIVWFEVVDGAENKSDQRRAITLLKDFELVEMATLDLEWAATQFLHFRLSHNIGWLDCLIGASSHRLKLPLYTHNLKHFTPLLGALAQKPY